MGAKNKYSFFYVLEKYGPRIIAILTGILLFYIAYKTKAFKSDTFEKFLDTTIIVGSITVGFLGVLLGVLFGIRNTDVVKILFEKKEKYVLKEYFTKSIVSGVSLVFFSMFLYARTGIFELFESEKPVNILIGVWGVLVAYTAASTFRIANIIMHIIFSDDEVKSKKPQPEKMDEKERQELIERNRKS